MKNKADKLEKIVSIVLCILFIPIILINVTMIAKSYIEPDHMPSVFGISPVVVMSGSMSPTFEVESLIFIQDVDPETLVKGDIITFLEKGTTAVTHRIDDIYVEDGVKKFITKGDANNTADDAITADQIEGKYIGHLNGVGGAVMFMQSTTGMILFIALPIALYLALDFFLTRKENQGAKKRTEELEAELAALRAQQEEAGH